jgi:chitodextrinase
MAAIGPGAPGNSQGEIMKKVLGLIILAASLSTAAYADCNTDMTAYLECIKTDYDGSVAKLPADATEDQKKQLAAKYAQKNDAAVDELSGVAAKFNEQLRIFKAKTPQ